MHDEYIETLYNDGVVMIKNYSISKICAYYKYHLDKYVRIIHIADTLDGYDIPQLASMIRIICERMCSFGYSKGYQDGLDSGRTQMQNDIKKLLNIKE